MGFMFWRKALTLFAHLLTCRGHLAKWQASKGTAIKKGPAPSLPPQPEKERRPQTLEEPAKSFWVTIVEEDEQSLFSETVNKMLAECLQHIEEVRNLC